MIFLAEPEVCKNAFTHNRGKQRFDQERITCLFTEKSFAPNVKYQDAIQFFKSQKIIFISR